MTSERITVTAADLQPGDRIAYLRASGSPFDGVEVKKATLYVSVNNRHHFRPDESLVVDRPLRPATLTFDVPEAKREAVEQAVQRVLDPPVKVGDRVRRTLPQTRADGGTGWQYEPGATGTVSYLYLKGEAAVLVDNDGRHGFDRIWRAGSFEVVSS